MKTIPSTDLTVSSLCLGSCPFSLVAGEKEMFRLFDRFVDGGGNFIDTANVYGKWAPWYSNFSEQRIGRWLRTRAPGSVIVATKGCHYDVADPAHTPRVTAAALAADVQESLASLGLETIDFYWLHRDDPSRPIGEILEACEAQRKAGNLRWYGASNFSAARLFEAKAYADAHGLAGFAAVSNQWSLAAPNPGANNNPDPTLVLHSDAETAFHAATGTMAIPFQATARGWFAKAAKGEAIDPGVARAFDSPANRAVLASLAEESAITGIPVQSLALVRLAQQPFPVVPITGASNEAQLGTVLQTLHLMEQ